MFKRSKTDNPKAEQPVTKRKLFASRKPLFASRRPQVKKDAPPVAGAAEQPKAPAAAA
jgi:hypothetical protein